MGQATDWLRGMSRLYPDRIAVVDGETGERWSYGELEQRAVQMAHQLRFLGISQGDRVALLSPNHIGYFELLFACGKIGAILVPLNTRLSIKEWTGILEDSTPKLLAYHSLFAKEVDQFSIEKSICMDQERNLSNCEKELLTDSPQMEDPWVILYTGGTTGKPKGVILSHRAIFWNAINTIVSWRLSSEDITLTYLPLFHTGGLNALSIPILHAGGTVILAQKFDAEKAIDLLADEGCTISLMVPTMYHQLIQSPRFQTTEFPKMREFLSGGASCPEAVYQAFAEKGIPFREGYGLTEAGPNNFYIEPEMARQKCGSVGRPMVYTEVKIAAADGSEQAPGKVGELWIRGGYLFSGYWNNPTATAEALVDGWLRTGDLARQDSDGVYYIVGRKKEMIITGGENVYPLEVERVIGDHPAVQEVSVVGLPDERWGEMIAAAVVLHPEASLTEEELRTYCKSSLGRYKVPKKVWFLDELPKTPVGKIDKRGIIEKYGVG